MDDRRRMAWWCLRQGLVWGVLVATACALGYRPF